MTVVVGNVKEDDFPPLIPNFLSCGITLTKKKKKKGRKLPLGHCLEMWKTTLLPNSGNLAPCEAIHIQCKNNRACGLIWYSH